MVLIGIAQESVKVFRPPTRQQRRAQKFAAGWAKAYVKQVYFYIWDRDFGPSFIKFNTYAPFQVRVWLNGHQWLRQHLDRSHHAVEPLDNGIAAVDDPLALQRLCARFTAAHIQRFFDRWLYPTPSRTAIVLRVIPTSCPCCNSRSVALRSLTARSMAASF